MRLYEDHPSSDHRSVIDALAFSPDGSMLVSGSRDGTVIVRDAAGGSHLLFNPGPKPTAIHSLACLPNVSIAVGHERGWDRYRSVAGNWQIFGPASSAPTTALAALNAQTLAIGTGDRLKPALGSFELFDLKTGRRLEPYFLEPNGVRAVAACPAKMLVAWSTGHKELKVWDVRRQTPLRFAATHTSPAVALAPDGSAFAAAQDWAVRLWDLNHKQERALLKGHKGIVSGVAFSPDSSMIATGSWDRTVKLWDAATGRERASFEWPIGKVFSLAYAPDGLRLAAGGHGAVVVWDVD
jgi:WD40 repeat protein